MGKLKRAGFRTSIHPQMSLDHLCIIAAAMAESGYRKEAVEMSKTCRAMWTYQPLWGLIKDMPGPGGKTRLMYCAEHGRMERLEWLLMRGANPDVQDFMGYTALHLAILNWQSEAVARLIAAGANLNLGTGVYGYTPLMLACMRSTEIVGMLCASGANLEIKNSMDQTAMQSTLNMGNTDAAIILQKFGAKMPKSGR